MSEEHLDTSWIDDFARRNGLEPLERETTEALLALAGKAAHESGDRRNAPIACFLAGLAIGSTAESPSTLAVEKIIGP